MPSIIEGGTTRAHANPSPTSTRAWWERVRPDHHRTTRTRGAGKRPRASKNKINKNLANGSSEQHEKSRVGALHLGRVGVDKFWLATRHVAKQG